MLLLNILFFMTPERFDCRKGTFTWQESLMDIMFIGKKKYAR